MSENNDQFDPAKRREMKKQYMEQKKQSKSSNFGKYLTGFIIVVLLAAGGWLLTRSTDTAGPVNNEQALALTADDHVKGPEDAAVTIIEYGDFQCPACAFFYSQINQLTQDYPDDLRVVFRHLPLTQIHQFAFASSMAAEAAGQQGKFWEYHDLLFERQQDWIESGDKEQTFLNYAEELGLDIQKFEEDVDNDELEDKVRADVATARELEVASTPTFYLNGELLENPSSYEEFSQAVQRAIEQEQNTETPTGQQATE